MKYLISFVFWLAGVLFFIFSAGILSVCLFIFPKPVTFRLARFLFSILIRVMGIHLEVEGQEHVDPQKSYLILGNHQSLFDLFVIPVAIPLCFTGVEAAYHFSIPVWGFLIRKWGCIPIERENLEKAKQSLVQARATLDSGISLAILPEGHRTRTGEMGEFKKGPFHLARAARPEILPFGISGLFEYQSRGGFLLSPGRVTVRIGRPIPPERYAHLEVEDLRDLIRNQILELSRAG